MTRTATVNDANDTEGKQLKRCDRCPIGPVTVFHDIWSSGTRLAAPCTSPPPPPPPSSSRCATRTSTVILFSTICRICGLRACVCIVPFARTRPRTRRRDNTRVLEINPKLINYDCIKQCQTATPMKIC